VDIRHEPDFAPLDNNEQPGLLEKYDGFGNHYYRVARIFISRECCDNKSYRASREDYLSQKIKAYESTMQSFKRGIAIGKRIVSVSNCGDILTDESDIGAGLRTLKRISGP
jgi:phage gp36-like protein